MASDPRSLLKVFAAFAPLAILVITLLSLDLRPRPVYHRLGVAEDPTISNFADGETLQVAFKAPGANVSGVHFLGLIYHPYHEVRFQLFNRTAGTQVTDQVLTLDLPQPRFDGANAAGDRLEFHLTWIRDAPPAQVQAVEFEAGAQGETLLVSRDAPPLIAKPDEPVEWRFPAPAADLNRIRIPDLTSDRKTRVKLTLINERTGDTLKRFTVRDAEPCDRSMNEANEAGDPLLLRLEWDRIPKAVLRRNDAESLIPLDVRFDGASAGTFLPAFMLEYPWPSRHLAWLMLPAAGLILLAARRHGWMPVALICAALCALVLSVLSWQQAYSIMWTHSDPDRFGKYGRLLEQWLHTPDRREWIAAFLGEWRYSWLPFTPSLIAIQMLVGVPFQNAYLHVVTLFSFGCVLLFFLMLRRSFRIPLVPAYLATILFLGHHFFLKAFAKPSTDVPAVFLAMLALVLVLERIRERPPRWNTIALAVLGILHCLARPPGFLFTGFFVGATLLVDAWRDRRIHFPSLAQTALLLAIPAVLVEAVLFASFGWLHNFQVAIESKEDFTHVSNPERFFITMVSMFQLLPLLIIPGWRRWKDPGLWLLGLWVAFYLGMLTAAEGGFISRLVLPVYPVAIVLAALGLTQLWESAGWRRVAAGSLVAFTVALNAWIVWYHASLPFLPPSSLARWIYH